MNIPNLIMIPLILYCIVACYSYYNLKRMSIKYSVLVVLSFLIMNCHYEIIDISSLYSTDQKLYNSLIGTFRNDEVKGEEFIVTIKEDFNFEFTFKQIGFESLKVNGKWAVKDSTLYFGDGISQLFKKDYSKSNSKNKEIWEGQIKLKIISLDENNIIVGIEDKGKVIDKKGFYRSNL